MLYRDRRLVSRREMDRRIRDRAAERNGSVSDDGDDATYFPALSRWLSSGTGAEIRAVVFVIVLVAAAFVLGRWVGQQGSADPAPQTAPIVSVI